MPVTKTFTQEDSRVCIKITDDFDARIYSDFKLAFETSPLAVTFEVDLSDVHHMDSSGLGLLVHLREHAAKTGSDIVLMNPSAVARRNLETAFFHEIFDIVFQT